MSKPAVQQVTAAVSQRMRGSSDPRTAIHAAAGAIPKLKPSTRCEKEVKRLVNDRKIRSREPAAPAANKAVQLARGQKKQRHGGRHNIQAKPRLNKPAGRWRLRVRGLRPSISRSTTD